LYVEGQENEDGVWIEDENVAYFEAYDAMSEKHDALYARLDEIEPEFDAKSA